jgi:hypothetical protein
MLAVLDRGHFPAHLHIAYRRVGGRGGNGAVTL